MAFVMSLMLSRADMLRIWLALALVVLTVVTFGWGERFRDSGPELIPAGIDSLQWRLRGEGSQLRADGILTMRAPDSTAMPAADYLLPRPPAVDHVRLSARVSYRDVARSPRPQANARIILAQRTADGRSLWHLPHHLLNEAGTRDWHRLEEVFRLDPQTRQLYLSVRLQQVSGKLSLRDVSLRPVVEAPLAMPARILLLLAWAVYLAWVIGAGYRRVRHGALRLVCVGLVLATLAGALLPHGVKGMVLDGLERLIPVEFWPVADPAPEMPRVSPMPALIGDSGELPWQGLHGAGHFIMFALLTVVVLYLPGSSGLWRRVAPVLAFAGITEVLQLLSIDRSASLGDVVIDTAGIALAVAAVMGWRRLRGRGQASS